MIKKLTDGEFMKRVTSMTLAEKNDYEKRVLAWHKEKGHLLAAKMQQAEAEYQNAVQCSAGWNDAECQAWEEGARLLTALIGREDTWLPDMLFTKSAKRAIKKMINALRPIDNGQLTIDNGNPAAKASPNGVIASSRNSGMKEEPTAKPVASSQTGGAPVRPKHIDQYVHLLPQKTQERAARVKHLLDMLDFEREQARLLMETNDATARAQHMKAATDIDNELRSIYKELDAEWGKLVKEGRVVVDDLGNARVVEMKNEELRMKNESVSEVGEAKDKPEFTSEQRERVRTLRHFLKDTRRGNGKTRAEHVRKWKAFYAEMVSIAGPGSVTDKVKEAAEHYGIDINSIEIAK